MPVMPTPPSALKITPPTIANDAERQIEPQPLAFPVDDLARNVSRNQTEDDPNKKGHSGRPLFPMPRLERAGSGVSRIARPGSFA